MSASKLACCHQFQSTLPVGGATRRVSITKDTYDISIHAPRGGSDPKHLIIGFFPWYFNPRSPWGERLVKLALFCAMTKISIHAPRGGSDVDGNDFCSYGEHFNPRSPWGERQQRCTDFSVNLWQKCIFSECFLRKSPGYSGWIFGKPLFLPQKFLRTSREFLGALASHGGRLTISQRIRVSSGR